MTPFQLSDSFSKKKIVFTSHVPKKLAIYVCGITPYDHAHLGHARCYTTFDTLVRFFSFAGHQVTYVRNYTDIDDKIIKKSVESGESVTTVSEKFITSYQEDMVRLNCVAPTVEPKVTQHIPEIIDFVASLIKNGNAYVIDSDVYFDISTFKDYGKLSGKNIEDLIAGHRVTTNVDKKRNSGDFALWKGDDNEAYWQSPWGRGRPGWHIECSAMARKYLGDSFDIHGGGMDLAFPHHENEIAQSESVTHAPLSQVWLHNAFININHEKMSKSLGNAVSLKDIFNAVDPMVLRYYFLQHHYRTPLDFNISDLEGVKTAYQKLAALAEDMMPQKATLPAMDNLPDFCRTIIEALFDDLNTPKALGIIFENLSTIKKDPRTRVWVVGALQSIFGLTLIPLEKQEQHITPEIEDLLHERENARQTKDWARADALREQLKNLGYSVQDKKKN